MASLKEFMASTLGHASSVLDQLKAITGKTNPFDAPDTNLAAAKTHIDTDIVVAPVHGIGGWGIDSVALGDTSSPGTATTIARSDHIHPKPSLEDLGAAGRGGDPTVTFSVDHLNAAGGYIYRWKDNDNVANITLGDMSSPAYIRNNLGLRVETLVGEPAPIFSEVLYAKAIACRAGEDADTWSNNFNISWSGTSAGLWIGDAFVGNLLHSGSPTVDTDSIISNAATHVQTANAGTTTLSANNTDYTVISHVVNISTACSTLWLLDIDWEHDRSIGVQSFYLIGMMGQTVAGVSQNLREVWIQRMDGINAHVVTDIPQQTLYGTTITPVGSTNYYGTCAVTLPAQSYTNSVGWGSIKLMGTASLQLAVTQPSGTRTLWLKVKRGGTHSSSAKINSIRSTFIEFKR